MVHSKIMIIDDVFLRVGSSNMNNRSMGMDTECDLSIVATSEDQSDAIVRLRDALLAEHLGCDSATVRQALRDTSSILATVDSLTGGARALEPVKDHLDDNEIGLETVRSIADPERPGELSMFLGDAFKAQAAPRSIRRRILLAGLLCVLVAFALAWHFLPVSDLVDPTRIKAWLGPVMEGPWAIVAVPAIFVAANLVVFPVTALIAMTSMIVGAWPGFWLALFGCLLSAAAVYAVGAYAGRPFVRRVIGRRLNWISRFVGDRGILTVVTLRAVPVAPFTFVNLLAGASHIRFWDFMVGTAIGMAPGIAAITFLGYQLLEFLQEPTPGTIAKVLGAIVLWLGISFVVQHLVTRFRK